jgi:glycine/D-amino acid oxidase-like deaminating enzyme
LISVVGAGLAGSLLALALAERGLAVTLIDPGPERNGPSGQASEACATSLSYGLLPPDAAAGWRRLQRRHGPLGLGRRWLQLSPRGLPLPAWQVDPQRFAPQVAAALERCGVVRRRERLQSPQQLAALRSQGPVVLACGAGCRQLAPQLDGRLRCSWAGILELEARQPAPWCCRWPGIALLPERFNRLELERRAGTLGAEDWIVDAGLVPCGTRLLAGQITLVRPGLELGTPPDAAGMEQRLRQGLAERWPRLAQAQGHYRQAAVSFCSDGVPLTEGVEPGLWVLAGFSGAFGQLPEAAHNLAAQIAQTER